MVVYYVLASLAGALLGGLIGGLCGNQLLTWGLALILGNAAFGTALLYRIYCGYAREGRQ